MGKQDGKKNPADYDIINDIKDEFDNEGIGLERYQSIKDFAASKLDYLSNDDFERNSEERLTTSEEFRNHVDVVKTYNNKNHNKGLVHGIIDIDPRSLIQDNDESMEYGWAIDVYSTAPDGVIDLPKDVKRHKDGPEGFSRMGFDSAFSAFDDGVNFANGLIKEIGGGWSEDTKSGFGICDVCDANGNRLFNLYLIKQPAKIHRIDDELQMENEAHNEKQVNRTVANLGYDFGGSSPDCGPSIF